MSKKKRFGLSENLNQGLKETINAAENHANSARYAVVALSRIEIDPANPRNLKITPEDIIHGISPTDALTKEKEELELLQGLATTILKQGLLNPIVVYMHGEKYRLVAGERRYLASLIARKEDVQAKILCDKPDNLTLRQLQWIENTEREDLSLKDRISNVRAVIEEFKKINDYPPITATIVKDLINISLPQATAYLAVLNAPADVLSEIEAGKLNNLDKTAYIAKLGTLSLRQKALQATLSGSNLKQVKYLIEAENISAQPSTKVFQKSRGRTATRINMGITEKPQVIRRLIDIVLTQPGYTHLSSKFHDINWERYDQVTKAFKHLIKILETENDKK